MRLWVSCPEYVRVHLAVVWERGGRAPQPVPGTLHPRSQRATGWIRHLAEKLSHGSSWRTVAPRITPCSQGWLHPAAWLTRLSSDLSLSDGQWLFFALRCSPRRMRIREPFSSALGSKISCLAFPSGQQSPPPFPNHCCSVTAKISPWTSSVGDLLAGAVRKAQFDQGVETDGERWGFF